MPGTGFAAATSFIFIASEFTASDGAALTYTWDFGDGSGRRTDSPNAAHVYGAPGTFTVTTTATSATGASASASVGPITVGTVDGRWGLRLDSGFLVRNSAITQNGAAVTGDDTSLNCRFTIGGEVTSSGIVVTWTRAERDCAGRNLPVSFSFRGEIDRSTGRFVGSVNVMDRFDFALLVPCGRGPCG
jgi:hypothetical protein